MKRSRTITAVGVAVSGLLLSLLTPATSSAAKPPIGRTYFVVSIGLPTGTSGAYDLDVGCVTFTATEICDGSYCGLWRRIDSPGKGKKQGSIEFAFQVVDEETGEPVELTGRADLDNRGRQSALGGSGTGISPEGGRTINFALGGRAVGAARCGELVAEFESGD